MNSVLIVVRRLACLLLLATPPALAGNIHFGLAQTDHKLVLTNQGNSTAYYPVVLRLLADGRWEPLPRLANRPPVAELPAGAQLELQWPLQPKEKEANGSKLFAGAVPVMVRFFDQAGAMFGQISFFQQPPLTSLGVAATYRNGELWITPPAAADQRIRASWLLWGQEEGIAALAGTANFAHRQAPARRIEWQNTAAPLHFNLGAGQPAAILLHETAAGLEMQVLSSGGLQGREQRATWLDAGRWFYALAALVAGIALLLGSGQIWRAWRQRKMA